jgi:MFS family permease
MTHGRTILILSIVFLVGSFATSLISPIWPIYIKNSLNASMTELGFVFSLSNAVAAAMQIPSGLLADRHGRRRLHSLGTLLAAVPPLMYTLAHSWYDLVPWAMFSGFAMGMYVPIRWAIVADVSSTKTMAAAYGWTNISWLVGSTVAPLLGGIVADSLGIRFPFFLCSILIFAVFPLTLLMQETRRKPQATTANEKHEETTPTDGYLIVIILFSLINIVQGIGVGVTGPVISIFVLERFPVDYTFIGTLFAIGFGAASIVVQIPASRWSDRFDRRKVMFVTFLASAPFFLIFAYSRNALELIAFMFISNAILNTSWPAFQTLMMEATPSAKWGLVNGVSAMTFWLGIMMGNALSGILWDNWSWYSPFYVSAFAIGASAILPLLLKETRVKEKKH